MFHFCSSIEGNYSQNHRQDRTIWDFITAAKEVDAIVGNVAQERHKPQQDEKARANMLNKLWASGVPLTGDDPASAYLAGRGVLPAKIPSCLRFVGQCHVP